MNKVGELFHNIPDEELKLAIKEIAEDNITGIYRTDGVLRKYARLAEEVKGTFGSPDLFYTEINLLRQGALRWVKKEEILVTALTRISKAHEEGWSRCIAEEALKLKDEL